MKRLFTDFITWLKTPDPDTTLVKLWKIKKTRDKVLKRIESKQQTEEFRQKVEKEAYFLWEADGKPEGKEEYYWQLAIDKIKGKNIPIIYKPYYLLEKQVLEPVDTWISLQAFFTILGRLGNLAIIAAVIAFISGEEVRRNNEVFAAWTTITTAKGQSGSGGRIEALEFLNSRPLRFPWIWRNEEGIWRTKEDLYLHSYWDEKEKKTKKECKPKRLWGFRWKRQPLAGLSAPKAYLANIYLCKADLMEANLQEAFLRGANLQEADLMEANLQEAILRRANLQKADIRRANLQESVLIEANLQESVLFAVNLQEAFLIEANLQEAILWQANLQEAFLINTKNLTSKQIKSACFWTEAIYKAEWNKEKKAWIAIEPDNTNFIEGLKKDKSSDPKKAVDCSGWKNGDIPT